MYGLELNEFCSREIPQVGPKRPKQGELTEQIEIQYNSIEELYKSFYCLGDRLKPIVNNDFYNLKESTANNEELIEITQMSNTIRNHNNRLGKLINELNRLISNLEI